MINFAKKSIFILTLVTAPAFVFGQAVDAVKLVPRVEVFVSPRVGSFIEGSTFNVPVIINTNGASIKSINLKINFDKNKLSVIQPSGGVSIVGVWTESPGFDNLNGNLTYIGTIPAGIITESGLVANIAFKALVPGTANITVGSDSKVILNDGNDTQATLDLGRADYNILRRTAEGVRIYSETHPLQDKWYNNNSPVFSWDKEVGMSDFSFTLDDKPTTIPDNTADSVETVKSYEALQDGLWYFHVKALKNGGWGTTGHFLVRIDTVPPADFKPTASYLLASTILTGRTLVSFFTIDNLSGIDHYEVGTVDENEPVSKSPVFIETGSPFQAPVFKGTSMKVLVRAIDKAGNIRDVSLDIKPPFVLTTFLKDNYLFILIALGLFILYYLIKYHIIHPFRRMSNLGMLETDIKSYVEKRKQLGRENLLEQEKIAELKRELEQAENAVKKEAEDISKINK